MSTQETILVFSLIGFGVQQFLQVVGDPVAAVLIGAAKKKQPDGTMALSFGIADSDAKKFLLGIAAFFTTLTIVRSADSDLLLLHTLDLKSASNGMDQFVSALALAAGTEGANSILKLLQYAKDLVKARAPEPPVKNP
jgi:hypothetical protein